MDSIISISSPFSWFSSGSQKDTDSPQLGLEPIETEDIEAIEEKPGRRLRQLIKLNHVTHSIMYNKLSFFNQAPHLLSTAYLFGADSDKLDRLYEEESRELEPWKDSPAEIGQAYDWRVALGKREYQRAYLDFFEDELVHLGYDWKAVVMKYLCNGNQPLLHSLIAGYGHPLIHLGFAFEMSSREIAMEALAMASCCYDDVHRFFDEPSEAQMNMTPQYTTDSPFEILEKVQEDNRFDRIFTKPGGNNAEKMLKSQQTLLLAHWTAWNLQPENVQEHLRMIQKLAATLMATRHAGKPHDFYFVHLLTTTHALRVIIPILPSRFHIPLLRQWLLLAIAVYAAQLRPKIDADDIANYAVEEKNWAWVNEQALERQAAQSPHYMKPLRSLREAAKTWGDHDGFYLRAAVKFIDTFKGFGGL